jgi:hypothetical protein
MASVRSALRRRAAVALAKTRAAALRGCWRADGAGVLMLGVDNLPAEFPLDASRHFSRVSGTTERPRRERP